MSVEGVGTVIYYNPVLCVEAGPELCQFFRMHEYGHIAMGHLSNTNPDEETRKREEAEADIWAAQNVASRSVQAAYRHFQAGSGDTPIHGAGKERAARVALNAGMHKSATAHYPDTIARSRGVVEELAGSRAAGLGTAASHPFRPRH
jgi:hypothetical protein